MQKDWLKSANTLFAHGQLLQQEDGDFISFIKFCKNVTCAWTELF